MKKKDKTTKVEQSKKSIKKNKISLFHVVKYTPLICLVFLIVALIVVFANSANVDQSLSSGTVFTVSDTTILTGKTEKDFDSGVQKIKDGFDNPQKYKFNYKFDYNSLHITYNFLTYTKYTDAAPNYCAIGISTNINDKLNQRHFLFNLRTIGNANSTDPRYQFYKTSPVLANVTIKALLIAFGASIGFITIYIIFRLDWAQIYFNCNNWCIWNYICYFNCCCISCHLKSLYITSLCINLINCCCYCCICYGKNKTK